MRADAQRNYDKLLGEARQAFITHGTEVALEDIARHAGVGVGTLYRHFPDRYALMNAVFEEEVEALAARGRELLTEDDAAEALITWLHAVAAHSTVYRGLAAAIMVATDAKMPACRTKMPTTGGSLLWRAQQAGTIRTDVTIGDLLKLTYAIVVTAEKNTEDQGLFGRLLAVMIDGIRTRAAAAPAAGCAVAVPATPAAAAARSGQQA
ncbi:transcriptional regulator, TetR family [Streptomyces sp. DvalAA-14]|uniref:TetR/AcrR family transcriptional regulator n=1 Tax=unclassified Streptomyces TaxID=2593676 RepID=UPI00081B2E43|nr:MULTISPECIES: TetR/AcrR family transcriptional regulator [unclassified Streptomyces]MYS19205.1 TetR family transcriptional regulator [Streptomyces sp. SID4948]SCD39176.1 transcriptional regulator, TetR family [Streptomyces sp. DvalAA-14]